MAENTSAPRAPSEADLEPETEEVDGSEGLQEMSSSVDADLEERRLSQERELKKEELRIKEEEIRKQHELKDKEIEAQCALREKEIETTRALKESEIRSQSSLKIKEIATNRLLKTKELDGQHDERVRAWWSNPFYAAIVTALLGIAGTVYTGYLNARTEELKQRGNAILEAIKTGVASKDQSVAAANLVLLADTGVITLKDDALQKLRQQSKGVSPSLPAATQGTAAPARAPDEARAFAKISSDANYAMAVLNDMFGQKRESPAIVLHLAELKLNVVKEPELMPASRTMVLPAAMEDIPDITYYYTAALSLPTNSKSLQGAALSDSCADVLAALVRMRRLKQDEKTFDWVLGRGYVAYLNGENVATSQNQLPFLSFKSPGTAYKGQKLGDDPQVAHMNKFNAKDDCTYAICYAGIPNKAFYETSMRIGAPAAGAVWVKAIKALKPETTFDEFANATAEGAEGLLGAAGRKNVEDAWNVVGLKVKK